MNAHLSDAEQRLQFFRQLQTLANKIHATHDVDEIMLDLSPELCALFSGDRLTIYAISEDKGSLVSKLKTGLASFKQLKLPISAQSVAGYAALSRRLLNVSDVYDEAELKRIDPELNFQQGVDRRTGYRTQQMLVAPILDDAGEVLGVLQLCNAQDAQRGGGQAFDPNLQRLMESFSSLAAAALEAYIREQHLRQEIRKLRVEVDEVKRQQQVNEIVETDFFQQLRSKAHSIRSRSATIAHDAPATPPESTAPAERDETIMLRSIDPNTSG